MLHDQILCLYSRLAYGAYSKIQISNPASKIQIQKYIAKFHLSRDEKFPIPKNFLSTSPYPTSFQFSHHPQVPQSLHQSEALQLQSHNNKKKKMSSANDQKKMTAANRKKQQPPIPTPPIDEKKEEEMVPLHPVVVQCPSLRPMPNRLPIAPAATIANNPDEEMKEMANLENTPTLEDKLAMLEDKEITCAKKTSRLVIFTDVVS
jgi:hypothetical protein